MAPFNFKKKLTKDKKQSSSASPPLTSTPSKGTSTAAFQSYFQQQRQQQQQQFNQHQAPKQPEATHHQQQQQQQQQQQYRVYPTPPPIQQRNVSGASTALPQPQREYTPWNRVKLQDSPFPRYRHVASSYVSEDNRVYVIGGLHDESVYGDTWIINVNDDATKFTSKTVEISDSTPPPRVGHAATLCGNAFVIFGGDTHKVNNEGLMDDDLYLFNINSFKWTVPHPVGPRPLGRYGHKISVIATNQMKTKLYLFGGQFDDTYFNDLAVYDLSSFRRSDSHWEFLKPKTFVPPPLANHTMVSYDNKLWVFGGDTLQGLINQVFMYDIMINDWALMETTGAVPPPLQEHAALIYKDLMCVVGGKDERDVYSNSVYFLNLKSLRWFKFPLFKAGIPQGRSGHSITLLKNDKLLIMGGDKFDYARQGEYDLNTTDTDMGKGTLLYTLDLSRLQELCPGIFDASEPFNPTTPPINNSSFAAKTSQAQPNILTPYERDVNQTPTAIKTPQKIVETPKSKLIESNENSQDSPPVDKNAEPEVPPRNSNRNINEMKKPVSPVPRLTSSNSEDVSVPRVVSLSSGYNNGLESADEEIGIATVASSPLKGDVKYDILHQHPVVKSEVAVQKDLKEPVNIKKSDDTTSDKRMDGRITELERSIPIPEAQIPSLTTSSTAISASKEAVDRDVVNHLRSELEELKSITEKKADEASSYIRKLEDEIQKLTSGTATDGNDVNVISLQSRCDILEADRNTMQDHIAELEKLLNAKFLELGTINNILKEQTIKIEEYEKEPSSKQELKELQEKYEKLVAENEELKKQLDDSNDDYRRNVKNYSVQLDELVSQWSSNKHSETTNDSDQIPSKGLVFLGNNRHHQVAIDKLQKRLDELLENSNALKKSREKLDANYKELRTKHSTLSEELLSKKTELEKVEGDYKDTLSSATNASKALEMSQQELQRYKQANQKLKEELDELVYAHESSVGDLSNTSENRSVSGNNGNAGQDSSMKFARYNVKINDLKAELYIIKQERDTLKDELLQLKKKQLVLDEN